MIHRDSSGVKVGLMIIVGLLVPLPALSAWQVNGDPVCTAWHDQYQVQATSDGVDGAIIAWVDERSGDRDVFARRCWADGRIDATYEAQTVTIDGSDDFLPDNRADAESGDTEYAPLDIQAMYVANDGDNLYIGIAHDESDWTDVLIGIAIGLNTAAGGTNDPWARQLEWSQAISKPDYVFYVNLDSDWQAGYR